MEEIKYQCIGCGAEIQTEDPEGIGYLPESALRKGLDQGQFYCQRCFRLRHYNELQDLDISDDVFLDKLSQIAEDDAFIIYVIDLFDIEGSLISGLPRFIGQQPFVVVANKVDLLPKSVKKNRLEDWIRQTMNQQGLYPEAIFAMSAKKPQTLESLTQLIQQQIQTKNIYVVGVTNVGKSTLINQLLDYYGGDKTIITTSNYPGTTLDLIYLPLTDDHGLIDTPGIIRRQQLGHYLSREELKQVLPAKPIKPKTFQLNAEQTVFLAGLARLDYLAGERNSFTFYVANDLYLHRTKLAKADDFYQSHRGDLLSPPAGEYPDLVARQLRLKGDQDIAISGLGWINIKEPAEVTLWLPEHIHYSIRRAII